MFARFRLLLCLVGLLLISLSVAQEVRPGDLTGFVRLRRKYEKAAEKANYHAWPLVLDGEKGTVVCITYDVSNLDATLITSKAFPLGRLTEEGRKILAHMDRRKAAILTLPGQRTMGVDLEFNPYIERERFSRKLELDLAALGAALRASDLPRPIHVGIGFEKAIPTVVQVGTKRIEKEKFAFFSADDLVAGSRMTAEARASWWALPGVLLGIGMLVLVFWGFREIRDVQRLEEAAPLPEMKPVKAPEDVQKAYDRSRPAFLYVIPMLAPMALCGLMDAEAAFVSLEILSPVPFGTLVTGYMAVLLGGVLVMSLASRARRKAREAKGSVATPFPLPWLAVLMAPAIVLAFGMGIVTAIPVYSPEHMQWRRYALYGLLGIAVLALAGAAIWAWRRRVVPPKITEGPIYETTMDLARLAGTKVRGIRIDESESINASASLFSVVGVTRGLLDKMEPEEIRAVLAHEVGHLAYRHVARILLMSLPLTFGVYYGWFRFTDWLEPLVSTEMYSVLANGIIPIFILNGIVAAAVSPYRRRLERDADAFAVRACGDPELVIRTLVKLHTLNESPHRLKPMDEAVASHPSLVNRIAAIRAGVS